MYPDRSQVDEKVVANIFPFLPAIWWLVGTDLAAATQLAASTGKVAVTEPVAGKQKVAGTEKNSSVLDGWLGRIFASWQNCFMRNTWERQGTGRSPGTRNRND
jgi:hypothetical protein